MSTTVAEPRRLSTRIFPFAFVLLIAAALSSSLLVSVLLRDVGERALATNNPPSAAVVKKVANAMTAAGAGVALTSSSCEQRFCTLTLTVDNLADVERELSFSQSDADSDPTLDDSDLEPVAGAVARAAGPNRYVSDSSVLLLAPREHGATLLVTLDRALSDSGVFEVDGEAYLKVTAR